MKFKVGDKVRVRKDLSVGFKYEEFFFTSDMMKFAGEIVTIVKVCHGYYDIDEDNGKWCWTDEMIEPNVALASFTKSDLKNGMVIECRNGERGIILKDEDDKNSLFLGKSIGIYLSAFTDTLEYGMSTIDKVYISSAPNFDEYFNDKCLELVWERPAKKMTVKEIEKELGYKIEIVTED